MGRLLGILIWGLFLWVAGPEYLIAHWEAAMVWFAALMLVPEGLLVLGLAPKLIWVGRIAGIMLPVAYLMPDAPALADVLMLLYVLFWVVITAILIIDVEYPESIRLIQLVRCLCGVYGLTGAMWAFFAVTDIRPLGFEPVIIGLTAAHFLVAGFSMTTIVYAIMRQSAGWATTVLGYGIFLGMPMVATGIVTTHFQGPVWIEAVGAVGFVLLCLLLVFTQWNVAANRPSGWMLRLGSFCLLWGIGWAALYALRFYWPIEQVHIPNMKIWHGTVQALGFGFCSLLGWSRAGNVSED